MADQNSIQDENQVYSIIGASGTADTAETVRLVLDPKGWLKILLMAEDSAALGQYHAIQGVYDASSRFVLLTTGGTAGTVTPGPPPVSPLLAGQPTGLLLAFTYPVDQ